MEIETSDEARVRRSIVEATVQHYPLLSETQEVNAKVGVASVNALSCVKRLNESLAKLQVLSQAMARTGQLWRREKQVALNTVTQHQKLLAFLEAPAVLDDCICNEMYHEALLVLEHIVRSAQPMHKVELFRRVENKVRRTLERTLADIVFPRLAESLTVASAVKVTTFLRRLGVGEGQIRELFLWKRAEYVDGQLREAEESGVPYSRIFRHVAAFKVHVSEVILQYTACFSPDTASGSSGELVAWCRDRAFVFVESFRASLERITSGSELASVIEQCCNSAATVSSVHMDVSGLMNEALVSRVRGIFAEQMALAAQSYAAAMSTFSWRLSGDTQWAAPSTSRDQSRGDSAAAPGAPPMALVQWLPLAYALNGLLVAFNAVRKCVVPGVEAFCVARVVQLLRTMARDIARDKELLMAVDERERRMYLMFVDAFVHEFYPHVLVCVQSLFGDEAQRILRSGVRSGVESLRSILPPAEEAAAATAGEEQSAAQEPIAQQQQQQPTFSGINQAPH